MLHKSYSTASLKTILFQPSHTETSGMRSHTQIILIINSNLYRRCSSLYPRTTTALSPQLAFPFIHCIPVTSESSETMASESSAGFVSKLSEALSCPCHQNPTSRISAASNLLRPQPYFTPSSLPLHHLHVFFEIPCIFSQE